MSIFDFPRINFQGFVAMNPGTANNDDYAQDGAVRIPISPLYDRQYWGKTLGLIDSLSVKPRTYGMSDADFIEWSQHAHPFDGSSSEIIPAEWNYYGPQEIFIDGTSVLGTQQDKIAASITSVQTGPNQIATDSSANSLVDQPLTLKGLLTDINSEGSPPATQFFINTLNIGDDITVTDFSKGVSQWLNFYRNVNLTADGGAGGYVYHVVPKDKIGGLAQYFTQDNLQGVIFRYYLYRPMLGGSNNDLQNTIYPAHDTNAAPLQIVGTIAPWLEGEDIITAPTGRLLIQDTPNIPTPETYVNNAGRGGTVALAPAVLDIHTFRQQTYVSIDCVGTFPEAYDSDTNTNPKFGFGTVTLHVKNSDGSQDAEIGEIQYDTEGYGDDRGWVFDFDITNRADVNTILEDADATFYLKKAASSKAEIKDEAKTTVLSETKYYFVSNQMAVYGEQNGSQTEFLNEGATDANGNSILQQIQLSVYSRGQLLDASNCPSIQVWSYMSNPIQSPGNAELIAPHLCPGDPIVLNTDNPGNYLLTFTVNDNGDAFPPWSYNTFMMPPYITNAPSISIRILPNEDFSAYYDNPENPEYSANSKLTWDVVYENCLRTYYLLYPAMQYQAFDLSDCATVAASWKSILQVTEQDRDTWMGKWYMPRTRDLSNSRRTLLRAWCRKVGQLSNPADACEGN